MIEIGFMGSPDAAWLLKDSPVIYKKPCKDGLYCSSMSEEEFNSHIQGLTEIKEDGF